MQLLDLDDIIILDLVLNPDDISKVFRRQTRAGPIRWKAEGELASWLVAG